jgi:hypothetical protein
MQTGFEFKILAFFGFFVHYEDNVWYLCGYFLKFIFNIAFFFHDIFHFLYLLFRLYVNIHALGLLMLHVRGFMHLLLLLFIFCEIFFLFLAFFNKINGELWVSLILNN